MKTQHTLYTVPRFLAWLASLALCAPALAETPSLVVTTASDSIADDNLTSLREAVAYANSLPGDDTINFEATVFATSRTITLTEFDTGLENGGFGPTAFIISSNVTIQGPTGNTGVTIERSGSASRFRLFQVQPTRSLTINSLTLSNGIARGGDGNAGGGAAGMGGAIFNQGTVTIQNSTLSGHQAQGGQGAGGAGGNGGGGVGQNSSGFNGGGPNGGGGEGGFGGFGGGGGSYASDDGDGGFGGGGSSFNARGGFGGGGGGAFNGSGGFGGGGGLSGGGGGGGMGGAIFNESGTVTITNSTLGNNTATGGAGGNNGQGLGGAVFTRNGTVTITHGTLSGNTANQGGGAVFAVSDSNSGTGFTGGNVSLTLNNSILANTAGTASDFAATTIGIGSSTFSGGGNLIGRNAAPGAHTGTFTGNIVTSSARGLGPLANNGGPTQTMALSNASPAFDAGDSARAAGLMADQRGYGPRIRGIKVDIGAYEAGAVPVEVRSFIVTTRADTVDAYDQLTSLREAISFANAHPGADTITFGDGSGSGGTNFLDTTADTITLAGSQLSLTDTTGATMIQGTGTDRLTVDGNNASRILQINGSVTAEVTDPDPRLRQRQRRQRWWGEQLWWHADGASGSRARLRGEHQRRRDKFAEQVGPAGHAAGDRLNGLRQSSLRIRRRHCECLEQRGGGLGDCAIHGRRQLRRQQLFWGRWCVG